MDGERPDQRNMTPRDWGARFSPAMRRQGDLLFLLAKMTGAYAVLSVMLSLALFAVEAQHYERFADFVTPLWPLLYRSEEYMAAHQLHDFFLKTTAVYSKDLVLFIGYCIVLEMVLRKQCAGWVRDESREGRRKRLYAYGLLLPVLFVLVLFITGPAHVEVHRRDVFTLYRGGLLGGIFFYTWMLPFIALLYAVARSSLRAPTEPPLPVLH